MLDLLGLYSRILDELYKRGVVRSVNNPAADYAEHLVCEALSLTPAEKSTKGYDAVGQRGKRYEVKARRRTKRSKPRRFSPIRGLDESHFDYLVAVVFAEDFTVERAAILTAAAVRKIASRQEHVNAWIVSLNDRLWTGRGVRDTTEELRAAQAAC